MFKKGKKQVNKLRVTLIDEKDNSNFSPREYQIPKNGRYKIGNFGEGLSIFDEDGDLITKVNWQAGFTHEYNFIYKETIDEIKS